MPSATSALRRSSEPLAAATEDSRPWWFLEPEEAEGLDEPLRTEYFARATEAARFERVVAALRDPEAFLRQYLAPTCEYEFGPVHREVMFDIFRRLSAPGSMAKENLRAARGFAKTTILARALPLYCLVSGSQPFILIVSDTFDQALKSTLWVRDHLAENIALREDFGRVIPSVWQQRQMSMLLQDETARYRLVTAREMADRMARAEEGAAKWRERGDPDAPRPAEADGEARFEWLPHDRRVHHPQRVTLMAASARTRLRGLMVGDYRPHLIICDDLENEINVRSPVQRLAMEQYFHGALMKAFPSGGKGAMLVIGTTLHPEALVCKLQKDFRFRTSTVPGIVGWPECTDLWDQVKAIVTDRTDPDALRRIERGRAIFEANRAEMTRGAREMWPEGLSLYSVMLDSWAPDRGMTYVQREILMNPAHGADVTFDSSTFARFDARDVVEGRTRLVRMRMTVDFAKGRTAQEEGKDSDFVAIALGGRDASGVLHVLDGFYERAVPSKTIDRIYDLSSRWRGCVDVHVEEDQCGIYSDRVRVEAERAGGRWFGRNLLVHPLRQAGRGPKDFRIAQTEPLIKSGLIRFSNLLPEEALLEYDRLCDPKAHDDFADAIEMLWRVTSYDVAVETSGAHGEAMAEQRTIPAQPTGFSYDEAGGADYSAVAGGQHGLLDDALQYHGFGDEMGAFARPDPLRDIAEDEGERALPCEARHPCVRKNYEAAERRQRARSYCVSYRYGREPSDFPPPCAGCPLMH